MKNLRQTKILELIKEFHLDTQEDLQRKLQECGFNVTQATVSRDIRELGIIKTEGDDGIYKYRAGKSAEATSNGAKFSAILHQTVSHVAFANNLIVVKTHSGMGSAAGAAVDSMEMSNVVGTLAGDDTLLIIATDVDAAKEITNTLNEMIGK
jgi:transcriptional regulator of arginine metabolism